MKNILQILCLILVPVLIFSGCGIYREYNLRPDDELSRAVKEAVGKDFYYLGKEEYEYDVEGYSYQIKNKEKESIIKFVNTINNFIKDEQTKIQVIIYSDMNAGLEQICYLKNFSDSRLEVADYKGLYFLYIRDIHHIRDEFFYEPSTYTVIEGVKKLSIHPIMEQKAKEQDIDWYESWPDLEEIIVRDDVK